MGVIRPISLPQLQKISKNAKAIGYNLNLNVDMFNYLHKGTISKNNKLLEFILKQYNNKIVLSFKDFDKEIYSHLSIIFNENFDIVYKGEDREREKFKENDGFIYHVEWWLISKDKITKNHILKIKNNHKIKIIALKQRYVELQKQND